MATLSKHAPSFPLIFRLPPPPNVLLIGKQQFHLPATIWKPPGKLQSYPPLAFFVSLFGAYGRIPVFCSWGPFPFFHSSADEASPALYLTYTPPKTFTGVSSTVSICPILDKTTYPGKISEQSKNSTRPNLFCPISQVPPKRSGAF